MCAKHIIKKAIVELTVPSADNAFKAQATASAFFKSHIYPMLEKVLDELDVKEEIIRLEKFELNFRNFHPGKDNSSGLMKLEQQIREKLKKVIDETKSTDGFNKVVAKSKRIVTKNTRSELFFHILKTGVLPWWAETDKPVLLEELAREILRGEVSNIKADLVAALKSPAARKRLMRLPESIIETIIQIISVQLGKTVNELLSFLEISPVYPIIKRTAYLHALTYSGNEIIPLRSFVAGLLKAKPNMETAEQLYAQCSRNSLLKNDSSHSKAIEIKQALADVNNEYWGKIKKMFLDEDAKQYFNLETNEKTPGRKKDDVKKEHSEFKKDT